MKTGPGLIEKISHPAVLSALLWIIVLTLQPLRFEKYRIVEEGEEATGISSYNYFHDIDNDGTSERLNIDLADAGITKLIFLSEGRIINQYNLRLHPVYLRSIYFGDCNLDGFDELFIFTMNSDSIFLNIVDPVKRREVVIADRFIDFRRRARSSADPPSVNPIGMYKRGDGTSDFIFYIGAGFCLQPRNVYRYMIHEDSLLKSPRSGASIGTAFFTDITGDTVPEIVPGFIASGNLPPEFPYSDQYLWLMALDINMQFMFEPFKVGLYPGFFRTVPVKSGKGFLIAGLSNYSGTDPSCSSYLSLYTPSGREVMKKHADGFEHNNFNLLPSRIPAGETFYLLKNRNGDIDEIDIQLNTIRTKKIIPVEAIVYPMVIDADSDGAPEYIFDGWGNRSVVITRENLDCPVEYRHNGNTQPLISKILKKGEKPLLYFNFEGFGRFIRFEKFWFYHFKYPYFAGLYLLIFGLMSMLAYMQKLRLNRRRETELQIASLQMRAIKNQLDPHFTLNILNSIGGLYATVKNRQKADYLFGKFAKLIRDTVISSDKVAVTVEDEIEFIRNYIELERFRCENRFDFKINIDTSFDMTTEIPRMLIHTFVENAIKHGVKAMPEGGLIKISLTREGQNHLIVIENTYSGGPENGNRRESTGKGLKIINEMIGLFYKLRKIKITYTIDDFEDPPGNKFKRVILTIPE